MSDDLDQVIREATSRIVEARMPETATEHDELLVVAIESYRQGRIDGLVWAQNLMQGIPR